MATPMMTPNFGAMTPEQIALDAKLHLILAGCLTDKAMDVFCNIEDGNGLEVYRQLARANAVRSAEQGEKRKSRARVI